jgi:hypothetical protein
MIDNLRLEWGGLEELDCTHSKLRKTPSWPMGWPTSALYSYKGLCFRRNAWARSYLLGRPDTFLAQGLAAPGYTRRPQQPTRAGLQSRREGRGSWKDAERHFRLGDVVLPDRDTRLDCAHAAGGGDARPKPCVQHDGGRAGDTIAATVVLPERDGGRHEVCEVKRMVCDRRYVLNF